MTATERLDVMEAEAAQVLADYEAGADLSPGPALDVQPLVNALRAVEALHQPYDDSWHSTAQRCGECEDAYPCPTVAAIERNL